MSEHTDDVLNHYLFQQPGMREALLRDPVQKAQVESLRQTLTMLERALADEGIPEEVARRVVNRIVWGDPKGQVDVHARMMAVRKQMLAVDLPPDLARAWREFPNMPSARPDEEPTT
jgi:hypothetical protein